jgi:dipeptidyl aminopeptidase/acylaminoacyl peptidase
MPSRTRLRPDDLCTLPLVSGAAVSPQGDRVAFSITIMDPEADTYAGTICIAAVDGSGMRRCTRGTGRDAQPRWSPDGDRLLFLSDRTERRQVWLIDARRDDAEPVQAFDVVGNVAEASFSPDGRSIALITTPDTRRREAIARGWRRIARLRYRADGLGYLDDFPQLWIVDLESGDARQVTDGRGVVAALAWSPDGRTIAFAGEHRLEADSILRSEVWTVDVRGGPAQKIVSMAGAAEAPAWSPDGSRIAFVGHEESREYALAPLRLYTVARDGSDLRCLTGEADWACGNVVLTDLEASPAVVPPAFLADGSILVLGTKRGCAAPFRVGADGTAAPIVPADRSAADCSTAPGVVAFCASDTATPPEVFVCGEHGEDLRRLTHETASWCKAHGFERARRFTIARGDGGVDVWHLRGNATEPRACVLEIHGGPHFAYGENFMFEFRLLADAGFDVVYANPRGSQSYGEAFGRAIVGAWAAPAFDDCMVALDRCIDSGEIDSGRLGVAGGSYGGYLTLWTLAHTDRFRAGVAMRCASNLVSLWGTSEVGRMLDGELAASPQENPEIYRANSPLTFADRISAPTLIIHSENDFRCPIEQADQIFTALRRRGAEVEYLRFLGSDHGLTRAGPPKQRVAHLEATLDWFARHLT